MKLKFIFAFISMSFALIFLLWYEKEVRLDEHLTQKTYDINLNYNALYNEYKTLSQIIHDTLIANNDVILAFEFATINKDISRKNLQSLLESQYEKLSNHNLKQLHFHLPNNESLLRFHRPQTHGDDLSEVRPSVAFVNSNKKPYDGFEEGRIYNGYRFVYPLFNHLNDYLGSVEISFSTLAFNQEFIKNYHTDSNFFILKSVAKQNLFSDELNNYTQSVLPSFYVEKDLKDSLLTSYGKSVILQLPNTILPKIEEKILSGESFSIYNTVQDNITTFIPITNRLKNEVVGVLTVDSLAYYIKNKNKNFMVLSFISTLTLALFFIFIFKNLKNKETMRKDAMTLQTIFEEVDSGIGLIDIDGNFLKINQKFAQLLGYGRGELFLLKCTDLIIEDERDKFVKALKITKQRGLLSRMNNRYITKKQQKLHFETSLRILPDNGNFIVVINSIEDKLQLEALNDILDAKVKQQVRKLRVQDDIMIKQSRLAAIGEMVNSSTQLWQNPIEKLRKKLKTLKTAVVALTKNKELENAFNEGGHTLTMLENSINDFHAFFKAENEKTSFSVKEAIENSMLQRATHLNFHNIEFRLIGEDFQIRGYKTYFLQVMLNLINNSKDAIVSRELDDGVITVELNNSQVIISDNAKGIPEHIFPKIFEPYVTTKSDGTGIGLYMVKQLIKMMDARIDVKNSNQGAKFIITFSEVI